MRFGSENVVKVYRIPVSDVIKIEGLFSAGVDVKGLVVIGPQMIAGSNTSVGLEKLKTGIYYIRVSYDNGDSFSHRFVKAGHF
ncbi:hypothetical protein [Dyadobacter sp. LHD-138]|uniref:hypothetical protein n=1 Tax=Dyadobacter sp. LHD-138 TaxID=3071413 RepID=UPI0027E187BC|nr:hypothetical protein [Dyadobacter sp. LHD-138]MDQ6482124.1 hypothetical protein [Dyadobacter sp. LHD-138]